MKILYVLIILFGFVSCNKNTNEPASKDITNNRTRPIAREIKELPSDISYNKDYFSDMPLETILLDYHWYIGGYDSFYDQLLFLPDNEYTINLYEKYEYARGKYNIEQTDNIRLDYPFFIEEDNDTKEKIAGLFKTEKDILLELQRNYSDLGCIGRLYSKNTGISFYSPIPSPENEEYIIDNVVVIKKSGRLRVTETLRTRLGPSINAPFYQWNVHTILTEWKGEATGDLLNDPNAMLNVLFPGQTFYYHAVTKHKDKIDGHEEPWYMVRIRTWPLNTNYNYFWVYGGFTEELRNETARFSNDDYYLYLVNYLFANNYIKAEYLQEKEDLFPELFAR
jgi:hypothetical protein